MAGDIIVNIDGKEVTESSQIYDILEGNKELLVMHVYRGQNRTKVTVAPEAE